MKPRTLAIWAGVVVVLLALYVLSAGRGAGTKEPPAWLSFKMEEVRTIDLRLPDGGRANLTREGDLWQSTTDSGIVSADTGVITEFLKMLMSLRSSYTVTDSPEKYSMFDLEGGAEGRIALNDTGGIVLLFGKTAPAGEFTYMRREGVPSVYAIQKFDRWFLSQLTTQGKPSGSGQSL